MSGGYKDLPPLNLQLPTAPFSATMSRNRRPVEKGHTLVISNRGPRPGSNPIVPAAPAPNN